MCWTVPASIIRRTHTQFAVPRIGDGIDLWLLVCWQFIILMNKLNEFTLKTRGPEQGMRGVGEALFEWIQRRHSYIMWLYFEWFASILRTIMCIQGSRSLVLWMAKIYSEDASRDTVAIWTASTLDESTAMPMNDHHWIYSTLAAGTVFCSIPKYPLHAKQIMQNTKTYAHLPIDHDQHINLRIFIQNVMRFIRSLRYGVVWRDYLQHLLIVYDGRTCNNRLLHIFLQQHSKKRCGPSGHPRNWSFHRPSLALAQLCNFDQRSRARTVEVHVSSCLLYTLPAAAMSTRHIYTSLTFTHITTRWAMKSFIAVHYDNDIMKIQTNNMNRQMFGLVDSNNKP